MKRLSILSPLVGLLCVTCLLSCATQSGLTPFQKAKLQAQAYTEVYTALYGTVTQLESNPEVPPAMKHELYATVNPLMNTLKDLIKDYITTIERTNGEVTVQAYALHTRINKLLLDILPIVNRVLEEIK